MLKILLSMVILMPITLVAMTFNLSVDNPFERSERDTLPTLMEEGNPMVPFKTFNILLPQGHRVENIDIYFSETKSILENVFIEHAKRPLPLSSDYHIEIKPNPEVYDLDKKFPYEYFDNLGTARKRGFEILHLNIYAYKYNPVMETLTWSNNITVELETVYDDDLFNKQNRFLVNNDQTMEQVSELVINPHDIHTYQKINFRSPSLLPDTSNPFQMIIITSDTLSDLFIDYIDFRNSQGIQTGLFTVEEIYANYSGYDNQNKIRNFIIDAYETYSLTDTPLDYILIGGNDQVVPYRGMFGQVGSYVDFNMPSDIYYSNLDGTWDANNNGIYGEINDGIDWYAEVSIGRVATTHANHLNNFFNKTQHYVLNDSYTNQIAYMYGENLNYNPLTWGGDYKDEIIPLIPEDYHISTLYERDGTFSVQSIMNSINNGLSIINHIGHANYNYVFGLNNFRASNLINTEYGFAYTQGCYPAAFDYGTSGTSGGSVGQNLVNYSGGLFAFVGNTRYGWYMPGSTNGPSQAFDITFFQGLFDQNILELGNAHIYSREQLINQAINSSVMRWVFYQLILFGDPSIQIKLPELEFPYVYPDNLVIDDNLGDGDGVINPGETINFYIELFNAEGWANAEAVSAELHFECENIQAINHTVEFGSINSSSSSINEIPFTFHFSESVNYGRQNFLITITAISYEGHVFEKSFSDNLHLSLSHQHWPWQYSNIINASPIVFDLNNNSKKEFIITDVLSNIFYLDYEAQEIFKPFNLNQNIWANSALYYDTIDNEISVIIANRGGKVIKKNHLDNGLIFFEDTTQFLTNPVSSDLNNNGEKSIILFDLNRNLHIFDREGNYLNNFPVNLPYNSISNVAVADINNNGFKDIILPTINGYVYAIDYYGDILDNFPVELGATIHSSPSVLSNGNIVIGTNNNKMFIIDSGGEILTEKSLPGRLVGEPIIADFNNSGSHDIAFVTNNGHIFIVDQEGLSFEHFPIQIGESFNYPPVAADINNDGFVNLVLASNTSTIFAIDYSGILLDFFPIPLSSAVLSPLVIADIDNNNSFEIIFTNNYGVQVIDLKSEKGEKTPWSTFRGNYFRTASIKDSDDLTTYCIVSPTGSDWLGLNYPNPFNPETFIDFYLNKDSFVEISIFNIKGQKITSLVSENLEKGQHSIKWNGKNSLNQSVSSGIYFYRMTTPDFIGVRKMMLLK